MPAYLSEDDLRSAVNRLGKSSARSRMCEFLIGLRTLKLSGQDVVGVAESVSFYKKAVDELTRVASDDEHEGLDGPFFNPFGSQAGFKSKKFASNGPSNTMHGWQTQSDSPFTIDGQVRPKTISRRAISPKQLRTFLLLRNAEDVRPRLIDAALWYFRSFDFEGVGEAEQSRTALEKRFQSEMGLSDQDVAALFRLSDEDTEDEALAETETSAIAEAGDQTLAENQEA